MLAMNGICGHIGELPEKMWDGGGNLMVREDTVTVEGSETIA